MRNFNLKTISIITLSLIIFGTNTSAQRKTSGKRNITGNINKRNNLKRNATEKTATNTISEIAEDTTTQTITSTINTENIQSEIEQLIAQNNLIRNNINEKQTKLDNLNKEVSDLKDSIATITLKQNKSKSACTQLNIKKMEEIQGWLIASVASSGVGTVANTTATVTSFMQKDNSQIDKQNQKAVEKATEKAKNEEIQKLKNEQQEISNKIADNKITLNHLSTPTGDDLFDTLDTKGIEYLTKQNQGYSETYNEYEEKINDVQNNPFTGEINAKTTSYEKQEKKNKTLSTVSNISSIVGTVASGVATVTSTVATGLITTIAKQVKNCKETF